MSHAPTIEARSSSQRQTAALRAGITLLAMVGEALDATGAHLYLVASGVGDRPTLTANVFGPGNPSDPGEAPVIRAGLVAVAGALGLPLTVDYDNPNSLGLSVGATFSGVRVQVFARFTAPDTIAAARDLLTPVRTGVSR